MRAFVSGATGYIGSRLIATLVEQDHRVVAGMRDPRRVLEFAWGARVDAVEFDIEDPATVAAAVDGCDVAYFLVHSMASSGFRDKDARGAQHFAEACEHAGVRQVVYLSGLVPDGDLSEHLASRLDVEKILLDATTATTVLRAAVIIGAGSTSFELIRTLVERLPVLPMPCWMTQRVQPVASDDVVTALLRAGTQDPPWTGHRDLGGPDQLTYRELVTIVTNELGLRRWQVPFPPLPHILVGRVIAMITGIPANTVTELVKSLRHDMVCADPAGYEGAMGVHEAVRRALSPVHTGTAARGDRQTLADSDPGWAGSDTLDWPLQRLCRASIKYAIATLLAGWSRATP